ncbi:hypothetical protein [Propionibacterium sp.]|jgi:hypothetical protein|uniref:hypothetical protein n=1 Tax=Propionibacterium sp. TaxID=1977903 RepID=UPI0039E993DF
MRPEDFLTERPGAGPWGTKQRMLDRNLIKQVHAGIATSPTDIDAAVALARLVHDEYIERGTSNHPRFTVDDSRASMSALRAVLRRLNVPFSPPFSDFEEFYHYWKREGASGTGGWESRRQILAGIFNPVHDLLADMQAGTLTHELAVPVTERPRTGWTQVDEEIAELRRHFREATTSQDYRNIGNDCVIVLENLSAAAYRRERHLPAEEDEPAVAKTKARLERVVEVELDGKSNAELRKLVRAAIEQAQSVKHRTPDRRQAGIAADSVILLANIFRRLEESEERDITES